MRKAGKALLVLALVAAAVLLAGSSGQKLCVEYHNHTVRQGDTLWGIAAGYMPHQDKTNDIRELIFDISKANQLEDKTLQPGMVLTIPLAKNKNDR